jgi:hypothetical protein
VKKRRNKKRRNLKKKRRRKLNNLKTEDNLKHNKVWSSVRWIPCATTVVGSGLLDSMCYNCCRFLLAILF